MFVVWVIMGLIAYYELPGLRKKENRGELIAFSVLWMVALLYASLVVYGVKLPNPIEFLIVYLSGDNWM